MTASIALKLQVALININRGRRLWCHRTRRAAATAAQGRAIKAGWKVFWLSLAVFGAALGAERLVPDIVPIAFAEEPQAGWAVQLAFLLRSVELTTAIVAILALVLLLGTWARRRLRRGAL
jgi:hypothetical protein